MDKITSKGSLLVCAERERQIKEEGYSQIHDSAWKAGQLLRAAQCYLLNTHERAMRTPPGRQAPNGWPWPEQWWKPKPDRLRELTVAAALIIAEIDRILHEKEKENEKES